MQTLDHIPFDIALNPLVAPQNPQYTVFKNGRNTTYKRVSADSFSQSSITFSIRPPSKTFLDPRLIIELDMIFDFVASALPPGQATIFVQDPIHGGLGGTDGLRAYPLQQNCSNLQIQINNLGVSTELQSHIEPLTRYGFSDQQNNTWLSSFPDYHDVSEYFKSFQTVKNPLGNYYDNGYYSPRGAFDYQIIADDGVNAQVRVKWYESIIISPLQPNDFVKQQGFWNLDTLDLIFSINNLARMWSHDATNGATLSSVTVDYATDPIITYASLTPAYPLSGDLHQILPYYDIKKYSTNVGVLNPGQQTTTVLDTVTLHSVPSRAYIFAKENLNTKTFSSADIYTWISNISLDFANDSGILNSASDQELYSIAVNNGYNYSWNSWRNELGSVICIDFATDVNMAIENFVGKKGEWSTQFTITHSNIHSVPINFEIFQIYVFEGTLHIQGKNASTQVGLFSQELDITGDMLSGAKVATAELSRNFYGGDLWSNLKKYGSKAFSGAKKVGKFVGEHGPQIAEAAAALAPLLGLGYNPEMAMAELKGRYRKGDMQKALKGMGYSAGSFTGGRMIQNPSALRRRPSMRNRY